MERAEARRFGDGAAPKWLRLEYSQSFPSQPCRYLLRLVSAAGTEAEYVLPAPVLGRARWLGIVPEGCIGFEIWAVAAVASALTIDRIEHLRSWQLALRIGLGNPVRLPAFLVSLARSEPRTQMLRALTALDFYPLDRFDAFAAAHARPADERDLVLPAGVAQAPPVRIVFVIVDDRTAREGLRRTLRSLTGQIVKDFAVVLLTDGTHPDADLADEALDLSGLALTIGTSLDRLSIIDEADDGRPSWVGELLPGDRLAPEAVLSLRSFIAEHHDADAVYTDHAVENSDTGAVRPVLKPDWSPTFYEGFDYVDRLCLIRFPSDGRAMAAEFQGLRSGFARRVLTTRSSALRVAHLKRLLVTTGTAAEIPLTLRVPRSSAAPRIGRVSIIIPTRDRPELLQAAIDSLKPDLASESNEIIVVDNGSTDPRCLAYLETLRRVERLSVVAHPGAFNFSALINAGASRASGDVLILLNNDCAVLHEGWIEAMASLAHIADVGAVGAKLLYDNGTLQHAGVGIGLGGEAGHRNRSMPADAAGYLNRLRVVHEVSAVTAACLAVERAKFRAVGGFDEAFAVAFNDIDFCLRLRERGYRNLLTPHATLRHSESVSRGSDRQPSQRDRWSREAALFRQRWQPVILDDPYMHPLLSLWRFREVLQ